MPKSKHLIPGRVRSTYEFIKAHRDRYSVQMLCRVLEVAVSGYYHWLKQPISNHAQEHTAGASAVAVTDRALVKCDDDRRDPRLKRHVDDDNGDIVVRGGHPPGEASHKPEERICEVPCRQFLRGLGETHETV